MQSFLITGPQGGVLNDTKLSSVMHDATKFYANELGINKDYINYFISVGRTVNKPDEDARGWATVSSRKRPNKNSKKWNAFIFVMRQHSLRGMLSTLAHEMIHIKQFVKEGLDVEASEFKGKTWKARKHQIKDFDSPWEREAYSNEAKLAAKFLKHNKKVNK